MEDTIMSQVRLLWKRYVRHTKKCEKIKEAFVQVET